jgi:predicted ATPase/transcriptional regulator with XRE-family HTH domain
MISRARHVSGACRIANLLMAIEDRASFGELLRRYRLAAGLTQEALAATAGMSARGISDLERGARRAPYRKTVRRLAESLGLQANDRAEFLSAAGRPPRELPAPVSAPPRRHNLPMRLTSFVGRSREVARVRQLVRSNRLVTLTGPGGVGKTRLALEIGASLVDSYADGVWFVELASVDDGGLVAQAVANTLGVREQPGRSYAATLADVLQAKHALLVLDNCEHVLEPCGALATGLIHMAPGVAVLTTSREPLSVVGEVSWIVPTLSVSEQSDDQGVSEAVQLFEERARAIRPDFQLNGHEASVADLCARLDGLPLAIELAAARTRALPVRALLQMLESATGGLPILTGGPRGMPERQRTLRSAIGWSYALLDRGEQALFRRLAIFRGCTLDAIETVCIAPERGPRSTSITLPGIPLSAVDGAMSLVSKSLLRMDEDSEGEARYSMLETVREFALERLEDSGEAPVLRRRHALFYMRLAEDIEPRLYGADQVALLNQLEQEHANFRLALDWCQNQGYVEPSFRLALGLWMFWSTHGHVAEGSSRLASLLMRFPARGADDPRLILRAQLCDAAGRLFNLEGDLVRARGHVEEALALMEALEDTSGILNALSGLAAVANQQGDFVAARAYHERELRVAQADGKPLRIANAMYHRAMLAHDQGDDAEAQALLDQCATLFAQHDDPRSLGFTS